MSVFLLILWIITLLTGIIGFVRLKRKYEAMRLLANEALDTERTINYFATSMFRHNSVEDILWDVTKNCISRLNFEDCVIYLYDTEKKVLVQKAAYGPKNPKGFEIINPIEIPLGHGIVGAVFESGVAQIISDTSNDVRYIEDDKRRNSEISVPIIYQGKKIGIIDSEHSLKNFFNEKHLQILTIIASLCANKIESARMEEAYHKAEMKLVNNNIKIADARFSSLRLHIKPKFVLQCLLSINELFNQGKNHTAASYLNIFSKFYSSTFINSKSEWVTLQKELQELENYCKLQQLIFNHKFSIHIVSETDSEKIVVPPLLVQPFIEQAIWQNLKYNEKGQLTIRVWRENERVFFNIEDNGNLQSAEKNIFEEGDEEIYKDIQLAKGRIKIMNETYHTGITYLTKENASGNGGNSTIISMMAKEISPVINY